MFCLMEKAKTFAADVLKLNFKGMRRNEMKIKTYFTIRVQTTCIYNAGIENNSTPVFPDLLQLFGQAPVLLSFERFDINDCRACNLWQRKFHSVFVS